MTAIDHMNVSWNVLVRSDDLWLSHQHCTFCTRTTGVTSSVTPLTCGASDTESLFALSSEILGDPVLSFTDGFGQLENWRFIPDIKDQSSILSSFPFVLLQVLQVTVYSPPLCFSSVSTSGRSERWLSVRQNVKVVRF